MLPLLLLLSLPPQPPETIHATDDDFIRFAVAGNMAEVELAKVAVDHATDGSVKQFAQQMVADHDKAGREIKHIADLKKIPIPTALDGEHAALKQKLLSLKGVDFDRTFMDAMLDDHKKTVAAFRDEAQHGTDAAAKDYAKKTLPIIEMHRARAEKIDNDLGSR
ncbi:MAG TPA: DUF4142 domain-containing protein [Vicinamibacterales bacterium]|nr:DUF4142 domain-containing protein [Vicinamibacterales bacterium]